MPMQTFFAPAERAEAATLASEIATIDKSQIVKGLLKVVSGLLAVLDENRQILAVNNALLETFGISDATTALGLRPGEAIGCIHAHEPPHGCGTTPHCQTCGAVIAIVTSLATDQPVEKICVAQVKKNGGQVDLYLKVKAHPLTIDDQRFILLFLQDFSSEQQWRSMERVFFHDVNNLLSGLMAASDLLYTQEQDEMRKKLADQVRGMTKRLAREVAMQKVLASAKPGICEAMMEEFTAGRVAEELRQGFASHPAGRGKKLMFAEPMPETVIKTDFYLLLRILTNMTLNALEASAEGDEVRFSVEEKDGRLIFAVWNKKEIPGEIALRIFQKNFSTKAEIGHGLGTYSMKLFGEKFLRGVVDFTSREGEGTTFRISLPLTASAAP